MENVFFVCRKRFSYSQPESEERRELGKEGGRKKENEGGNEGGREGEGEKGKKGGKKGVKE